VLGFSVASGFPAGIFWYLSAGPFGPVILGMFATLVGAILAPIVIGLLAKGRFFTVGFGYAAGVAISSVIAGLVAPRRDPDGIGMVLQLISVFIIVCVPSLMTSGVCALLKWEDNKVRRRCDPLVEPNKPVERGVTAVSGGEKMKKEDAAP
jgi:hypothetical protein